MITSFMIPTHPIFLAINFVGIFILVFMGMIMTNVYGEIVLYKNDKIHREDDEPAIITNSNKIWMKNVKRHREYDKPGVVGNDGFKAWCVNGKYHREM